jgi:hypothetical protein
MALVSYCGESSSNDPAYIVSGVNKITIGLPSSICADNIELPVIAINSIKQVAKVILFNI